MERVQRLRALAAPSEDPSQFPSTCDGQLTTTSNSCAQTHAFTTHVRARVRVHTHQNQTKTKTKNKKIHKPQIHENTKLKRIMYKQKAHKIKQKAYKNTIEFFLCLVPSPKYGS